MIRVFLFVALLFLLAGVRVSVPDGAQSADGSVFNKEKEEKKFILEEPVFEAKALVVTNLDTNEVVFEKNPELEWPLASLAKLVTGAVFYEKAPAILKEGKMAVPITKEALLQEGDDGFLLGESFDAETLLKIMLVKSSNDAAYALSLWLEDYVGEKNSSWFVNEMNLMSASLGLKGSYFLNSTGLDIDEDTSGAYGSAKETADIFSFLLKTYPEIFSVTSKPRLEVFSLQGRAMTFDSTASPMMQMPGLIAVKTGYTDLAGGNLAFAFSTSPGRKYTAVLLGSSFEERFNDALKIYEFVLKYKE